MMNSNNSIDSLIHLFIQIKLNSNYSKRIGIDYNRQNFVHLLKIIILKEIDSLISLESFDLINLSLRISFQRRFREIKYENFQYGIRIRLWGKKNSNRQWVSLSQGTHYCDVELDSLYSLALKKKNSN